MSPTVVGADPGTTPPGGTNYYPIVQPHTDIGPLLLYVDGSPILAVRDSLVSDRVKLTMDGAHTLELVVSDPKRKLLRSGALGTRTDIQVMMQRHVYWFRLTDVKKSKDLLTLTFEDRHVQIFRQLNKKLLVKKGSMTRCQFIWSLVVEAQKKDPTLDFAGPCVGAGMPPSMQANISGVVEGIVPMVPLKPGAKWDVRIKGVKADAEQMSNINTILTVGNNLKARRKVLVVSIMVAIGESTIRNLDCVEKYGKCPDGPIGVFQQYHRACWPASQNVATDANAFFAGYKSNVGSCNGGGPPGCIAVDKQYPNITYAALAARTQYPGWFVGGPNVEHYEHDVQAWRVEAERIVTAWGLGGGDITKRATPPPPPAKDDPFAIPPGWTFASADNATQQWHRGSPKKRGGKDTWEKENSWDCINRMANEVQWYAFMVEDTLTFAPSDWFYGHPEDTIKEFDPGIDWIDGDYDRNKKSGTVTITTYLNKWDLRPGISVKLIKMGPWNGIWCVSEIQGSLSSDKSATVTLKKLLPPISESEAAGGGGTGTEVPPDDTDITGGGGGKPGKPGECQTCAVKIAKQQVGKPYVWGTAGPNTFDCSGLITYSYGKCGTSLPHNTVEQQVLMQCIGKNELQPGDLIFYKGVGTPPGHVAMYIGDGKMIEAPGRGQTVRIVDLRESDLGAGLGCNYGRVTCGGAT